MSPTSNRRGKRRRGAAAEAEAVEQTAAAEVTEDTDAQTGEHELSAVPDAEEAQAAEAPQAEADANAGAATEDAEGSASAEGEGDDAEQARETSETGLRSVSEIAPAGVPELDRERTKQALEALIFVSERIVTPAQLARAVKARAAVVRELIAELQQEYTGRGIELIEVGSGYQFRSAHACADYVREFVAQKPVRLTRAQLETLALIAYRQPITRPEIDEVRGVDSGSAMRVLLERNLIKMLGRKDEAGRPLLYGTTPYFLEFFSMRSLKDLPTLREFTDLSDENRALFKRKTGENVEDAEAELAAAEEAARLEEEQAGHISDEDLAELAAEADAVEDADGNTLAPPATMEAEPSAEADEADEADEVSDTARRNAGGDDEADEDDDAELDDDDDDFDDDDDDEDDEDEDDDD
jgi:segregation and condensation protein B